MLCVRVCVVPLCALWDLLVQKHKPLFGSVCFFEGPKGSTRSHVTSWVEGGDVLNRYEVQATICKTRVNRMVLCEWDAVRMVCVKVAWVNSEAALFLSTTMASALKWARTHWLCKTLLFCILNILVSRRKNFIMLQPLWYRLSAFVPCKTFTNWKKINKKRATFGLGFRMWMNELHFLHLKPDFSPAQYKNDGCLLCWLLCRWLQVVDR